MTTFNTGNAVPSADARDRFDNSQTFDEVINGTLTYYANRVGNNILSLKGMADLFNAAQLARSNEYAADKAYRDAEFSQDQMQREDVFNLFLEGTGWSSLGAYGAGISIVSHTQTVDYLGQPYALKPSVPASLDAPYVTTGVWATEGINFKLVGDNSLRQDLADPLVGGLIVYGVTRHTSSMATLRTTAGRYTGDTMDLASFHAGWALEANHPFPAGGGKFVWDAASTATDDGGVVIAITGRAQGRWVRPIDGPVNVTWWGAKGDGITIDRLPIQYAINFAAPRFLKTYVPARIKEYMIDLTLWTPLGTSLFGDGGRDQKSKLKCIDGHFTDMIVSGVHTEGVNNTVAPRVLLYRNGMPYTEDNVGKDISLKHLYLNGNGANAGTAPEFGPGVTAVSYRGSNVLYRFIDGVETHDIFSQYAPNDGCQIVRCRRVKSTSMTTSDNILINPVVGDTRNGLSIGGTLSGLGYPDRDYLIVDDIIAENTEDLGIAVQFLDTAAHPAAFSGTMSITRLRTKGNASYGSALEVYGDDTRQVKRKNFVIDDIISEGDNTAGQALSSLLLSQKTLNVVMSNYIVRDAGSRGLTIVGGRNVLLSNGIIDGFNTRGFQGMAALFAYAAEAGESPDLLNIRGLDIRGGEGRGGDTYGVAVSGFRRVKGSAVTVDGTTFVSVVDGAAILIDAPYIDFSHSDVANCGANGFRFAGFKDLSAVALTTRNVGKGGLTANQIGINVGAGVNRTGRISGCHTIDDQTVHTMSIGYLLGVSATDVIMVTGNQCTGSRNDPLVNLGMPNAYVHGNGFQYAGQTLPFNIGGIGNYLNGMRFGGGYRLWVEQATGKYRIKFGAPTSDSDGTVIGTQT